MCGITGKVYLDSADVDYFDIKKMNEKIAHRGPDDSGVYISGDKKVGMGNQRLSVIDLSEKGHMPMVFRKNSIITYNGEVYNFKEQRKILKNNGYTFHSNTDTEVILALYDKYGFNCMKYLRGMFAFAIYDAKKNIIFLARDRIGKKPLKYYFHKNVFIFASELKSILTQKEVKSEVDQQAVIQYLTYGYVISPFTGFLNINKLEPGHYLVLDIKNKRLKKEKYWKPDYSEKLDLSEDDWEKSIIAKLRESVQLRMVSDVPVGAFLSGGVDSSTVVALMSQFSSKPVNTFTIGFKDKDLDESKYAQNIVERYGTNHHSLTCEPENLEILPDIAHMYEEPFADASSIVTYMVSKLARKHVTVILNGDGGDENFVGYERFERTQRDFLLDKLSPVKFPLATTSEALSKIIKNKELARCTKFLKKSQLPFYQRYGSYIQYFSPDELRKEIIGESFSNNSFDEIRSAFKEAGISDVRDKALYWDLTRYLPEDLLVKVDIASMAVGLEARSPFLDQEFVDHTCKIPFGLKYKNGQYKYLLKKAIKDVVPEENINRRKIGFTIPLDRWFEGSLNDYAKEILLKKKAYVSQLFDINYIKGMLSKHSKENDFGPRLWSLLSLELWHRAYFS